MGKKILVSECSNNIWPEVFKRAAKEDGWQPIYWTCHSNYISFEDLRDAFPGMIIHQNYDAIRGIGAREFNDIILPPLDAELLISFSRHESVVMKMMDRMDPMGWFTYPDRLRLYHYYLKYWSYILDKYQPDILFTPVTPHLCYDYVLYQLCKKKNIQCILFIETTVPYIIYINDSFEEMPRLLLSNYERLLSGNEIASLSESSAKYLDKISGNYNQAMPSYMVDQFSNEKKVNSKKPVIRKQIEQARSIASDIKHKYITGSLLQESSVYYKAAIGNIEKKTLTRLELRNYVKVMTQKTKGLKAAYERIISEVDYDKPYVLVALMYQPERTSSPDGGLFVHQYLMIEWLSATLPQGWTLYVKEHASQFMMYVDQTRNEWFYEDMLQLPNVKFVDTRADTFRLIDNSRAVVTLTGTIGFETVVRRKPVLCFGYSWYRGCEGVFSIQSLAQLKTCIEKIKNGYTPDPEKIRKYVQALEETGVKGYVEPYYEKGFDFDTNVTNLKEAIVSFEENRTVKRDERITV